MDTDLFHVPLHIIRRFEIMSDNRPQLLATPQTVEIFVPFFKKNLIKLIFAVQHADPGHYLRVKEIIFKRIVLQDQYIFLRHPRQPVNVFCIALLIITAELTLQFPAVLPVAVPDHQEIIPDIDLVHVLQVRVSLDIRAAVGRDDGDPRKISILVIRLAIVFPDQQGQPALVLFALHDKHEIHIHQVIGGIAQIIQHRADIRPLLHVGHSLVIQINLPDLPAVKIGQQVRGMGGKEHLVLPRQPVQDIPGYFLEFRMKEDLRIFHHNDIRVLHAVLFVRFQQGKHIDAAHALSHALCRSDLLVSGLTDARRHRQRLLDIQIHCVHDLIAPAVSPEDIIHLPRKCIQVQVVKLIFQKLRRFKRIQLFRRLLVDQADAGKAAIAFLCHVKHTAAGPHLLQQIVLLHQKERILESLQIPLRIHKINMREDLRDTGIIFLMSVAVPDASFPVGRKIKRQHPAGRFPVRLI